MSRPLIIAIDGPSGAGKSTLCRMLARALNCERGPTPTPCGECVACREIRDGISYLKHMESKTDTRIVGLAQLNIDYENYHEPEPAEEEAVEEAHTL